MWKSTIDLAIAQYPSVSGSLVWGLNLHPHIYIELYQYFAPTFRMNLLDIF